LALKRTFSHIYCQLLGQFGIVLDLAKSNNINYNPKNQLFTVLQLFFPTPDLHDCKKRGPEQRGRHGVLTQQTGSNLRVIENCRHCDECRDAATRWGLSLLAQIALDDLLEEGLEPDARHSESRDAPLRSHRDGADSMRVGSSEERRQTKR